MTDETLEQRLRAFYRGVDAESTPVLLRRQVATIADVEALPPRRWFNPRSLALLAAAALLGLALIGSAILGAGLLRLNTVTPPSPTPAASIIATAAPATSLPSPSVSAQPTATASSPGVALIAYTRFTDKPNTVLGSADGAQCLSAQPTCPVSRIWLIAADGTGAHELFPDGVQDQQALGWSSDGSHLLYVDGTAPYVTDANGRDAQQVDTGCALPCSHDNYLRLAPDGTQLVFVRSYDDGSYAIATMDLASGRVNELPATTMRRELMSPAWSPDGRHIVFSRPGDKVFGTGPIPPVTSAMFIVDADGQNLREINLGGLTADSASWSADGSRILFSSWDGQGSDIYTVASDGTNLVRLTSTGISAVPSWTPDGRIVFARNNGGSQGAPLVFWAMDSDGTNGAELIPSDVTQAAGGPFWQPQAGPATVPPPWSASTEATVGPPAPTPIATAVPQLAAGFSWTGSLHGSPYGGGVDTATVLQDGRVLVTKKCDPVAEIYDPQSGTFSLTGSMKARRANASATLLQDGRVLIAGGGDCSDGSAILASAEVYDPASATFTATGSMAADRFSHTATLLNDGRVLIAGGITDQAPPTGDVVVLASYHEGLVAETAANTTLAAAELYDPSTGTFAPTGSMADFRSNFTATLLADGRVLVAGGGGEGYDQASAELYDPAAGTFIATGSMVKTRWLHTATLLDDGRVLITGGRTPNSTQYASAELYDPGSGRFSLTGSMDATRQEHTATLLQDGRVLIAGGYTGDGRGSWNVLASTEIYDPSSGQFSSTGSMGDARYAAVATRLQDGRVLIAGGSGIGTTDLIQLNSAVLYQP